MRLIDADALEQSVQASIAEYGDVYTGEMIFGMRSVVYYATNDAPTVDAIPIEWLIKHISTIKQQRLLEEWENENGQTD